MSKRNMLDSLVSLFAQGQHSMELRMQDERIVLQTYSAGQPIDLPLLVDRYQTVDWLVQFLGRQSGPYEVRLAQLSTVKSILKTELDKQLEVCIEPEVEVLEEVPVPSGWQLAWRWSYSRNGLVPETFISYRGDGWFLQGNRYWQLAGLLPEDSEWLEKPVISGQDLISFLVKVLQTWEVRKLPFISRVSFIDDPVLRLAVQEMDEQHLLCSLEWREPSALIFSLSDLPGYVLTGQSIRSGIALDRIAQWLVDNEQLIDLRGEEIPRFMQALGPATSCFGPDQDRVVHLHQLYSEPAELLLAVQREENNGLGSVQAVPMLACGELRLSAEWLSRRLDDSEFLRILTGWLPASVVLAAGIGRFGRALDGSALSPLTLTPEEILGRTSSRLTGPWSRIDFPSILLPVGETPEENARMHLDFLLQYGVPGGIVGPMRQFGTLLLSTLASFAKRNPGSRVLVIGTKTSLAVASKGLGDAVKARYDGGASDPPVESLEGIALATPRALDIRASLAQQEWDILGLLDADSLVKSKTTKIFRLLCSLHKEITLGLFALPDFYRSSSRGSALSQVFELTDYGSLGQLWRYVVRNLQGKFPVFPKSIWPQHKDSSALAEYGFGGVPEGAMPVPERSYYSYMPSMPRKQIEKFINTARHLADHEGTQVEYQFMTYYQPTYDYMTREQTNWYLHWRLQVRQGKYGDTGMAYIILHAYELINSIGVKDTLDGYEQLRRLWLNYRHRFPLLDATILGWASDYLLVNGCPQDPLEIYREAAELGAGAQYADLLLSSYLSKGVGSVPLFLWEQLSDYQVRSSRFYGDGHAALLKEYIPLVLQALDQYMQSKTGRGIFATWRPRRYELLLHTPFTSAIYAKEVHPIRFGTYLPYTKHAPLRHFLTSVLKHSENRLRDLKQFRGRLRGYSLEPWAEAVIDQVVFSRPEKSAAALPVKIDLGKVEQLTRESEKVRELLLKDLPEAQGFQVTQAKRFQPISDEKLLQLLSDSEVKLLRTILKFHGATTDVTLHEDLPGQLLEPLVDHINELFLNHTGDLLITTVEGARLIVEAQLGLLERLLAPHLAMTLKAQSTANWLADFPQEWNELFSGLADAHWLTLAACAGKEPALALRKISNLVGTMPELLIDELNDLALNTIGDILVHPGPELEEEYRPVVKEALRAREEVV